MKNIIIFKDGSRKWIGEKVAQEMFELSTSGDKKNMWLGNTMISFSSIAKIIDEKEYHEQYPSEALNKLPSDVDKKQLAQARQEYVPLEKQAEKRKSSFKKLLQGLKKNIDRMQAEGKTPYHAIDLYETKLKRYKKLFNN